MLVTVLVNGWPSFETNGLSWFGNSGDPVLQFRAMQTGTALPGHPLLYFSAWPLIWGTLLSTAGAVVISLVVSTLAAIFLTEFAPAPVRRVLEPVVRLLAGVPSVIYGLVGLLLIAPWVNGLLSTAAQGIGAVRRAAERLGPADRNAGAHGDDPADHDRAHRRRARRRPPAWREGSIALGVNRWRTIVARVGARRAARDRLRHGVRHRARAGRGDHARDARRRAAVGTQPAGRAHVLLRADPAAGGVDRQGIRRQPQHPDRAHRLCDRGGAAVQRGAALARRLGGQGSHSNATGSASDGERRARAGSPPPPRSCARAANRPRRGRWWTGWGTGCAGRSGSGCAWSRWGSCCSCSSRESRRCASVCSSNRHRRG